MIPQDEQKNEKKDRLSIPVRVGRCDFRRHFWSEDANAEGDTCECGEWYRFTDRIESTPCHD